MEPEVKSMAQAEALRIARAAIEAAPLASPDQSGKQFFLLEGRVRSVVLNLINGVLRDD